MSTVDLTTDQLRPGDVVYTHGMEIKLEGKPITYQGTWDLIHAWVYMPIIAGTNPIDGTSRWDVKGTGDTVWAVRREVTA